VKNYITERYNTRDIVLGLGCSFTSPTFMAEDVPDDFPEHLKGGWKMWPEIFTDKLSEKDGKRYNHINLGRSGTSMDYSARKFFEAWAEYKDKIKIVLWGGTNFFRLEHFGKWDVYTSLARYEDWADEERMMSAKEITQWVKVEKQWDANLKEGGGNGYLLELCRLTKKDEIYEKQTNINFNRIMAIKDLCESNGVKFMYYQLIPLFGGSTFKNIGGRTEPMKPDKVMEILFRSAPKSFVDMYESKSILGFDSIADFRFWSKNNDHLMISANKEYPNRDGHPSKEGQEDIARRFWEQYENHFV